MEADLIRFFPGVSLAGMRAGVVPIETVANCAAHIPRGGAVGEFYGGWLAVTAEVEAAWENSYILARVNADKPSEIQPRKPPEGVREREQREAALREKAERFKRRRRR